MNHANISDAVVTLFPPSVRKFKLPNVRAHTARGKRQDDTDDNAESRLADMKERCEKETNGNFVE